MICIRGNTISYTNSFFPIVRAQRVWAFPSLALSVCKRKENPQSTKPAAFSRRSFDVKKSFLLFVASNWGFLHFEVNSAEGCVNGPTVEAFFCKKNKSHLDLGWFSAQSSVYFHRPMPRIVGKCHNLKALHWNFYTFFSVCKSTVAVLFITIKWGYMVGVVIFSSLIVARLRHGRTGGVWDQRSHVFSCWIFGIRCIYALNLNLCLWVSVWYPRFDRSRNASPISMERTRQSTVGRCFIENLFKQFLQEKHHTFFTSFK